MCAAFKKNEGKISSTKGLIYNYKSITTISQKKGGRIIFLCYMSYIMFCIFSQKRNQPTVGGEGNRKAE